MSVRACIRAHVCATWPGPHLSRRVEHVPKGDVGEHQGPGPAPAGPRTRSHHLKVPSRGHGGQQGLPSGQGLPEGREGLHVVGRADRLGAGAHTPPVPKGLVGGVGRRHHGRHGCARHGVHQSHLDRGARGREAVHGRLAGTALEHHPAAKGGVKGEAQDGRCGAGGVNSSHSPGTAPAAKQQECGCPRGKAGPGIGAGHWSVEGVGWVAMVG